VSPLVHARRALLRITDRCIDAATELLTPLSPARLHPGLRTLRALASIPAACAPQARGLAPAILAARWRSALLLAHIARLPPPELRHFLARRVRFVGDTPLAPILAARRPLIVATPHCGANLIACLAVIRRYECLRPFGVLYRKAPGTATVANIFERAGARAELLSGIGGVVRALELLQRGGCIATMPDVFDDVVDTIAVPFFGRWLRVAAGLPFLAHRSQALILPAYVTAERGAEVCAQAGTLIDAREFASGDVRQDIFALTHQLFAGIERQVRGAPQHWLYWERLPRVSTPLEAAPLADAQSVAAALARHCRANPGLLRRVPELALLVAGARQ
jgi:lauroyl/myristoyl acyltransferase